jgi:flagellar export protein FliJ
MKPFTFRLESVLTLRTREEERTQETFGKAVQHRNQCERALDDGRAALEKCFDALVNGRTGTSNRTEQILLLNAVQHQQTHNVTLAIRLAAADRDVAARRGEFLAARRKREVLTRLRARQERAHRREQDRHTENEVADLITARHARATQEVAA